MNPALGSMKVDKILSQFSQMYRNESYIAEKILPFLAVKEKTGEFAKYGKENLRAYKGEIFRAPGTRAHTVDYSVSQGTYICKERSIEKAVPWEMYKNYDDPYDPRRDATEIIMDNIWVNQELALSEALSDTSVITQNVTLSGTDQWTDKTNSDPLDDIRTAIATVKAATGKRPNTMALGEKAFDALKDHPDIREQLKYTNAGQPSDDQLSTWLKSHFKLANIYVGDAVYNSADEGQTDSLGEIWGGNCWLFFQTARPSLMMATFGMTLSDVPRQVDMYPEISHVRDVVRVRYSYDQNIFDAALCYLIKAAVS